MTADVVVVSHGGGPVLASCLDHLAVQTQPATTVVVLNGAPTGTAGTVRARHPTAVVVDLPTNIGFGAGVAVGVGAGSGEAIVLVNDDVDVEPGFVAAMLAPLQADPGIAMVAGLLMIPGTDLVDSFGIELDRGLSAYNRLRRRRVGDRPGVLAMPSGGAAAYRRSAFEAVGGFDPALFAYGEDVDLGLRLRTAGWRAAAAPAARGVHLGGASSGVDSPLQRRLAGFARGFLLHRYGVLTSRAAPRALLIEVAVVGWGIVRHRTLVPLWSRVVGWRAAGATRLPVDRSVIDGSIGLGEALRRLIRTR